MTLLEECKALEADRDRYDRALQSLTPGGSEFVRNPERCVETVRALRRGEHEALVRVKQAAKQVVQECSEVKSALAAAVDNLNAAEARVKELEQERDRWMGQFDEAEHRGLRWKEEADAARARVKELREALEPFAKLDVAHFEKRYVERILWQSNESKITLRDVMKARAALKEK